MQNTNRNASKRAAAKKGKFMLILGALATATVYSGDQLATFYAWKDAWWWAFMIMMGATALVSFTFAIKALTGWDKFSDRLFGGRKKVK